MRIALFSDTYPPDINGVSTSVLLQKKALEEMGHDVLVVTTGLKHQRKVTLEDKVLRIPGVTLPFLYGYRLAFPYNHRAWQLLKDESFDVLHVQQEFGVSLFGRLLSRQRDIPMVYTFHTCYEDYTPYLTRGRKLPDALLKKVVARLLRFIGEHNAEIVTPSEKARKVLRGYGIDRPIHVLPSPMEVRPVERIPDEVLERKRAELHLEGRKVCLSLGRIALEKNLEETLSSFQAFRRLYPDEESVLLVVGDGPERKRLEKEYASRDILFLGSVPHEETNLYYQLSDVFLTSSKTETQGLTIVEAMENSLLVLARYDFNLEGFLQDGRNCLLYDHRENMPLKIRQALSLSPEERREKVEEARKTVERLYDPRGYAERIVHVYEKAIRREL